MRISFEGFEDSIELVAGYPHALEIESKTLFTRICRSLLSEEGPGAMEPYSLWSGEGEEVSRRGAFLMVSDPLNLPWDDKQLGGRLYEVVDSLMAEDEEARTEIESVAHLLSSSVSRLTYRVGADYDFGLEWSLRQFLKSRAFKVNRQETSSYPDSLIAFLDFCADMALKQVVVFVNLKTFLSENEVREVYERVFFHRFKVLVLESSHDSIAYVRERKTLVDQDFLESH